MIWTRTLGEGCVFCWCWRPQCLWWRLRLTLAPSLDKMCSLGSLSYFWTEGLEALTSLPLRPKDGGPYCSSDCPAFFFFLVEEEPGVEVPRPYSSCPVALCRCSRKRWCRCSGFPRIQASLERFWFYRVRPRTHSNQRAVSSVDPWNLL